MGHKKIYISMRLKGEGGGGGRLKKIGRVHDKIMINSYACTCLKLRYEGEKMTSNWFCGSDLW